jgi:hypothetical protein
MVGRPSYRPAEHNEHQQRRGQAFQPDPPQGRIGKLLQRKGKGIEHRERKNRLPRPRCQRRTACPAPGIGLGAAPLATSRQETAECLSPPPT